MEWTFPVEIPTDLDEALEEAEKKYWYYTVKERSKMFATEVWCISYEDEGVAEDESEDIDEEPHIAIYKLIEMARGW